MLRFEGVMVRQGAFTLTADFPVTPGAVTAVLGPSGSGKSTLLSAVAGFLPLAAGEILVGERRLSGLPPGRRPVSIVFQDGNLFPHLDVASNVALGVDTRLNPGAERRAQIAEVLGRVGLSGFETRMPSDLSGGQLSRVAIARVLLRKRPVVLLDEPFAALGPKLRREMLDLVAGVFEGETVLMVTHAPEDARAVAAETVFVSGGRAAPPAPTAALFDDPPTEVRDYIG